MNRSPVLSIACILALLLTLSTPGSSWGFLDFSEDALKSTGIIIGITAGVVILVVLIAGTIKDIKGGDEEEGDIWADLRENRTLSRFPAFMAGPLLVDDLRNAFSSHPPEPLDFQGGDLPFSLRSERGLHQKFAQFRIGGSGIPLPELWLPVIHRTETLLMDSRRFAFLTNEKVDRDTNP